MDSRENTKDDFSLVLNVRLILNEVRYSFGISSDLFWDIYVCGFTNGNKVIIEMDISKAKLFRRTIGLDINY